MLEERKSHDYFARNHFYIYNLDYIRMHKCDRHLDYHTFSDKYCYHIRKIFHLFQYMLLKKKLFTFKIIKVAKNCEISNSKIT